MKTEIFPDYIAFRNRADLSINGVSPEFAKANPASLRDTGNRGSWNCLDCSDCSDCSGCSDCSDCSDCANCSGCSDCSDCSDCAPTAKAFGVPVVPNIHQELANAALQPNALDMGNWHTCETTHCRAGWIVHLAGKEGRALEQKTSTPFAAMQIYKASSPIRVSPVRFFEDNETARKDIERCAQMEREAVKP
jgi:hypothetical protein